MNFSRQHFPQFGRNRWPGPPPNRPERARRIVGDDCQPAPPTYGGMLSGMRPAQGISGGVALLIEGDTEMRGMLRFFLEKEGYEVVDAATSGDAIESAKACEATTVLLSLDVTASDSVAELRELRARSQAHIIVLSSLRDEALMIRALDGGANDYLVRVIIYLTHHRFHAKLIA